MCTPIAFMGNSTQLKVQPKPFPTLIWRVLLSNPMNCAWDLRWKSHNFFLFSLPSLQNMIPIHEGGGLMHHSLQWLGSRQFSNFRNVYARAKFWNFKPITSLKNWGHTNIALLWSEPVTVHRCHILQPMKHCCTISNTHSLRPFHVYDNNKIYHFNPHDTSNSTKIMFVRYCNHFMLRCRPIK